MLSNAATGIPPIDFYAPPQTDLATFAMGCFWKPDALFGGIEGVVRTRVGYAGGTSPNPRYNNIGDHMECVQIDFVPGLISYESLVMMFLQHHNPSREDTKKQYSSGIFYHSDEQHRLVSKIMDEIENKHKIITKVFPYRKIFLAEDRHQKYKLQRNAVLFNEFKNIYFNFCDIINSTAAARINAFLGGYYPGEYLMKEIDRYGLSAKGIKELISRIEKESV
ncbi:MAG: peptide-methionine (S)-S-oxide reductase MsrA [Cytophagaceae bacterium]